MFKKILILMLVLVVVSSAVLAYETTRESSGELNG